MHRIASALLLALSANSYGIDWATSDSLDQLSRICHSPENAVENCSAKISERANAEIARRVTSLRGRLLKASPSDAEAFQKSQSAWVFYRDSHCALESRYATDGDGIDPRCLETLNIERVYRLRRLDDATP
ncbi:MAG: lysozyme inhibitor LprI family protein [Pseudomonadota bacterium]